MELFQSQTGTKLIHVPYKGSGPALVDLVAGQIKLMFTSTTSGAGLVKNGKLKAIAVTSRERVPVFPELPTLAETVAPGYELGNHYSIFAPAGTPKADPRAAQPRGLADRQHRRREGQVRGGRRRSRAAGERRAVQARLSRRSREVGEVHARNEGETMNRDLVSSAPATAARCTARRTDFRSSATASSCARRSQSVDLRFANCERQYSDRGANARAEGDGQPHGRQPPEMAKIFTDCGFDAVTIANNHMYDFGPEALLDTRKLLLEKGIAVTGAGRDLDEARKPAIVEKNGIKVGFLGYCSVIPEGGEAGAGQGRHRASARHDHLRRPRPAREPARHHARPTRAT